MGIGYGSSIEEAEKVMLGLIKQDDRIHAEPEPFIAVSELADSSVNFVVRAWTKTEDYWDVYWDLMRGVKLRFDEEGISIPFPQRDVHFYPQTPALVTEESVALEPDVERSHIQGRAQISDTED
jgi:small conductance mechanosensitive channel